MPEREYRSGLAEVVKYGVILDAEFFAYLEGHVAELQAREKELEKQARELEEQIRLIRDRVTRSAETPLTPLPKPPEDPVI